MEILDFSFPYNAALRAALIGAAASSSDVNVVEQGTYGATCGPRLETVAEIRRMALEGCTIVGMTGMPEASLAAELHMAYACMSVVVNPAAGVNEKPVDMTLLPAAIEAGMEKARSVLHATLNSPALASLL